jgi:hypothetical protein
MPTIQKNTLRRVLYTGIVLVVCRSLTYQFYNDAAGDYTKLMLLKVGY